MSDFDTISYTLILNKSNCINLDGNANIFEYPFASTKKFSNAKIALSSVSLFNSFFNISPSFNNNTFSYIWYSLLGAQTINITIPEGHYNIEDLNAYLQSIMIQNDHYLIDSAGNFVYYLEIVSNSTFYSLQLNSYPIPSSLPSGFLAPITFTFPVSPITPQFIIPNTGFSEFLGINAGSYPPVVQSTNYSKISDQTPKVNRVENIILRCNIVNNYISNPPDILYSFSQSGVIFGGLIQNNAAEYNYVDVNNGYYDRLQINFVDQDLRSIKINDPSVVILLSIKEKREQ